MGSDELYKFYDGTLTSVKMVLHDIASNPRMREYGEDLRLLERLGLRNLTSEVYYTENMLLHTETRI
ncbi:hypothetical protein Tco_0799880 [Tanacetum coccineum]|uniref:Uncharacterized protein n=1 Tax=Tanacetum coccineum TaxID=301880 RepID=A0ABQ4ZSK3_9ASTR